MGSTARRRGIWHRARICSPDGAHSASKTRVNALKARTSRDGVIRDDDAERPNRPAFRHGALKNAPWLHAGYKPHSMIATARVQPAEPPRTLTGKQLTVNPLDGSASRLCSFSMWQ